MCYFLSQQERLELTGRSTQERRVWLCTTKRGLCFSHRCIFICIIASSVKCKLVSNAFCMVAIKVVSIICVLTPWKLPIQYFTAYRKSISSYHSRIICKLICIREQRYFPICGWSCFDWWHEFESFRKNLQRSPGPHHLVPGYMKPSPPWSSAVRPPVSMHTSSSARTFSRGTWRIFFGSALSSIRWMSPLEFKMTNIWD